MYLIYIELPVSQYCTLILDINVEDIFNQASFCHRNDLVRLSNILSQSKKATWSCFFFSASVLDINDWRIKYNQLSTFPFGIKIHCR